MPAKSLESRTVLVTGGGGFIGTATLRTLAAHGAQLRTILGAPGQRTSTPPSGVSATHAEIDDPEALREAVAGVDAVVHLAGPASVAASFESPEEYARVHTGGTAAVLEACRLAGVRRLVYVSSAEVYGQPRENPVGEDHPMFPRSPYGAFKLGAEAMVQAAVERADLDAVVLRPFSVYGPGLASASLLARILQQSLYEAEVVLGDPRPVRDYCYVDDVADAIARACALPRARTAGSSRRVYNIGTGRGTSVAALADLALEASGRAVAVRDDPARRRAHRTDVLCLIADPTRAEGELGWRAATPLVDGLRRTVAWMQQSPTPSIGPGASYRACQSAVASSRAPTQGVPST